MLNTIKLLFRRAKRKRTLARNKSSRIVQWQHRLAVGTWIFLNTFLLHAAPESSAPAQSEDVNLSRSAEKGVSEWGWNTGGAPRIPGGAGTHAFWTVHLRWGRVLTSALGPGLFSGTLEYTVEIIPAFVMRQSTPVFGAGVNPFLLQYNFVHGRRMVPFIQVGAGTLFTNQTVPVGSSKINFTPQGGIGIYMFRKRGSAFTIGVRYHHISNAGMVTFNPGHNSVFLYSGISWWR
jgi:lipid A 3-O-deacylase